MPKQSEKITAVLDENAKRRAIINSPFNPVTGHGSTGERFVLSLSDYPIQTQYLPIQMRHIPLIRQLGRAGSLQLFLSERYPGHTDKMLKSDRIKVIDQFIRLRCRYDFPFWAAMFIWIKNKGGGGDVRFVLNKPQRKLITLFEEQRIAGKPIRVILLKARQWGGSTCTQMYMMWLQLVHKVGLNSLIIAHQGAASDEVKAMFDHAIREYPVRMLYKLGDKYNDNEKKLINVGHSGTITRIPQRSCNIKIGTAERPDSSRAGDYSLVHLSEVGVWKKTEGKSPQDIVRAACASVIYRPYTLIVYESTANGTGNFFHNEYQAAKSGHSMFKPLFVAWYEIELYSVPFDDALDKLSFAKKLVNNRFNEDRDTTREPSGKYLWWLWQKGASLEAINWYILERGKYDADEQMQAEFPTDDTEAFVHSGARVFDMYKVEAMRQTCKPPLYVGDIYGDDDEGGGALSNLRFKEDQQGMLWVWDLPDIDPKEKVRDRYLVVVDIGGRSRKADWSVIVVFDRLFMIDGEKPLVVAQWYGHIDMDILSWKAVQIAAYYDNALLVIESNTLETHDRERMVDGDLSHYILNQIRDYYPNLYARRQSEQQIAEGAPKNYGFHTNVATKPMIISTLVKVVRENLYIERDERCLDEYLTYEQRQNGSFGAIVGKHDDLLMTRAIGLHICFYEMELPKIIQKIDKPKPYHIQNKPMTEATI